MEFKEDIPQALELAGDSLRSCRIVALRPTVAYELDKRGIPYATTLEYGGWEERCQIGLKNFEIVRELTEIIDKDFTCHSENISIKPAQISFYYLKILFDVLLTKIHLLQAIISDENPEEIIAFSRKSENSSDIFPFNEDESVFAHILELPGWNPPALILASRATVGTAETQYSKERSLSPAQEIIYFIRKQDFLFNMGLIYKKRGKLQMLGSLKDLLLHTHQKPVIIHNSGYNWDFALPEFLKTGIYPVIHLTADKYENITPEVNPTIYNNILSLCRKNQKIMGYAKCNSIDAAPILFDRIATTISNVIKQCIPLYMQSRNFFEQSKAKCLLTSTQAFHSDRVIIQAASDCGMKIISWQHGGSGYCYHPLIIQAEFINSDIHLVFGEGVKKSHIETCRRSQYPVPEMVAVGSSWFDEERKHIKQNTPVSNTICPVLFITEKFWFNLYYNSTPFDSTIVSDQLWQIQKRMIDLAHDNENIPFIFKLHPADHESEPVRSYVADNKIKNIRLVVQEPTVKELLPGAGLIVIDFVATSILEVLLTEKPVFVYVGIYEIDTDTLQKLRKRAFVYENLDKLYSDLKKMFSGGENALKNEYGVDYYNTDFIREFGTYKNDGKSAARAVEIVNSVYLESRHNFMN